jgi:hypothetical protein
MLETIKSGEVKAMIAYRETMTMTRSGVTAEKIL